MILADKIIEERKKNGWTQEDLAQKLGVSRQSVSKWESAGAIPDLKKIIQLADLFGVSTDYLLKDEVEKENDFDLIAIFEEQFARALSPIEINIIKEWKNSNYSDDMIVKALKEAVKSQVFNFRYIERILINWSQNGVKQRYIEQDEPKRVVPISDYKWWENE